MTVDDIEQYFIPFGQSGYLSPRKKFEIMLFVLEKDYGRSYMFLEGKQDYYTITSEDIEEAYLQWVQEKRLYLSEEEKKEFFVQCLADKLGLGVLEVLKRVSPDGILAGELCPAISEQEPAEQRIAVCFGSTIIRFPFLAVETKEEMIRIVKAAIAGEKRGELSMMEPILDFVREDGTCMTAVRPPFCKDWGIRILYGASRKDETVWRM